MKKIFMLGRKYDDKYLTLLVNDFIKEENHSKSEIQSNWITKTFRTKKAANSALKKFYKRNLYIIEKQIDNSGKETYIIHED
jgi:hypothetical protein